LHFYLNQHTQLCGSTPKEIHYFDRDIHFGKTLSEYQGHFRGSSLKYHFESSPSYLYSPESAANIKNYYPEIRLIVSLREPIKRAYSAYNHYRQHFETGRYIKTIQNLSRRQGNLLFDKFFKDRTEFPSFRECIDIELDLIGKGVGFEPALLRRGLYLQQLENYWKYFDPKQIKIIGFKDLIIETETVLRDVTSFVGAEDIEWSIFNREPKNTSVYQSPIAEEDQQLLEEYYAEPNRQLFERIGKLNW